MLSVTLRQLQRGASLSLADCFRIELGMAAQSFEQGDFPEGVRAVLIDKDNTPRWQPSRVEDVTDEKAPPDDEGEDRGQSEAPTAEVVRQRTAPRQPIGGEQSEPN